MKAIVAIILAALLALMACSSDASLVKRGGYGGQFSTFEIKYFTK